MSRTAGNGGIVASALAVVGFGVATWLWVFGPLSGWAIPIGVAATVLYYLGNYSVARNGTGLLLLLLPLAYIATLLMGAGTTVLELVGRTTTCEVVDRAPYGDAAGSGVEVTVSCPDGQRYQFNESRATTVEGEDVLVSYDPAGRVDPNLTQLQHDAVGIGFMVWTVLNALALALLPVWIRLRAGPRLAA